MDTLQIRLTVCEQILNQESPLHFRLIQEGEDPSIRTADCPGFLSMNSLAESNDSKIPSAKTVGKPVLKRTASFHSSKAPSQRIKNASSANFANNTTGGQVIPLSEPKLFAECIMNDEKFFMCAVCSYKSKDKRNMMRHTSTMHSDNPPSFNCTICSSSFKHKFHLKTHYMKKHNLLEHIARAACTS